MPADTLRITEIFYSIQGESTWAGLPCVFVRLTGCHLRCRYCDTAYAFKDGAARDMDEIVREVCSYPCNLIQITGGEPLLQPRVHELIRRLSALNKTVLIETSGACDVSEVPGRGERSEGRGQKSKGREQRSEVRDQRSDSSGQSSASVNGAHDSIQNPKSKIQNSALVSAGEVILIMDLKTPGSGEAERTLWSNIDHLTLADEVKFVITDRADFDWAVDVIQRYELGRRVKAVLLSAVHEQAPPEDGSIEGCAGLPLRDLAEWMLEQQERLPPNVRLQTQLHKLIWDPQTRGV